MLVKIRNVQRIVYKSLNQYSIIPELANIFTVKNCNTKDHGETETKTV